ncbi:MAG: hypothetical protein RMJ84_02455 [Sandaracinaceae bacterium]|nr:hypothetical protein [Sandaracinaceae bacterium]
MSGLANEFRAFRPLALACGMLDFEHALHDGSAHTPFASGNWNPHNDGLGSFFGFWKRRMDHFGLA